MRLPQKKLARKRVFVLAWAQVICDKGSSAREEHAMTYTTKIVKNPINNRFEVLIAAIGSTEVFKHGSYKTYSRAEAAAKKATA